LANIIKAPNDYSEHMKKFKVFLAGSIEMGKAGDWQTKVQNELEGYNLVILNPRRYDWDDSWEQKIENDKFREQVEWELQAMDDADMIAVYIDPETKSPITLMEIGLHAHAKDNKMVVCCPDGFYRKGNVDIVCNKYEVIQSESLNILIQEIIQNFMDRIT